MNNPILVSVLIPVYNNEKYITECVESVLREDISEMELLLLDDGSTDGSGTLCEKLVEQYPQLKYYKLPHAGVSATRNAGLDHATGKYVFFLDADDRVEKGLISGLLRRMEEHSATVGNSILRRFGDSSISAISINEENPEVLDSKEALKAFIRGKNSLLAIGGKMILRETIGEYRFRQDLSSGEDTYFVYDIIRRGGKVVFDNNIFYEYRIHDSNTISKPDTKNLHSILRVMNYLYEQETDRVGKEEAAYIWNHHKSIIQNWVKLSLENENGAALRKGIIENIKYVKDSPVYVHADRRFQMKLFAYIYFWLFYRAYYAVMARMKDMPKCCGCGACVDVCPTGAIGMSVGKDGFAYPTVDASKCIHCGKCEAVCPFRQKYDVQVANRYFALQAEEPSVREVSTSGGAFRLLAEQVLAQGGLVVGASMEHLTVRHIVIEDRNDLERLQGSKYVQSETAGVFGTVKQHLEQNRMVLFSGTPCQVDGLRRYLGKDYPRLVTADLICNGVTSPLLWTRYTKFLSGKYGSKLLSYSFRDKREKNDGHTIAAGFENGEKTWKMSADPFCSAYFKGLTLRKQCESCLFCTSQRECDITLGDFWGIDKFYPEMNDGMGTSLVIVHTGKGQQLFDEISSKARVLEVSAAEVGQPRLYRPANQHERAWIAQPAARIMPLKLWFKIFLK